MVRVITGLNEGGGRWPRVNKMRGRLEIPEEELEELPVDKDQGGKIPCDFLSAATGTAGLYDATMMTRGGVEFNPVSQIE